MSYNIVFVKGMGGGLNRFALLDTTAQAAFVCREDAYADIVNGQKEPPMIGFPIEDVFLDENALRRLTHA